VLAQLDAVEQIAQRGERQLHLRRRRPRGQHAQPGLARGGDAGLPARRLADPGLAAEQQRARRTADQLLKPSELGFPG
jgi:hypothetical protein